MILNNAPQNEAIVSNVGQIGEFRIRNSAKAFNILSSGLYANKIRAVIRELSCNAVDSHIASGNADTPFDVHLPNALEPWFAIRDYGTGLNHEQVTNIYTTYFESTKTDSNDYIGALGLGSKSPFSYTDNFTVTAIRNGKKGIYTAFINEQGIPSIALMMSEDTDEPSGVEVKFAVTTLSDYDKFRYEARQVYKYFAQRPVISGSANFQFEDHVYESRDIIPGVHQYQGQKGSNAVMGNIAYGIAIPDSEKSLGDLRKLITCGLEIHFGIGELDFQASREGLSYIPQTVEAIRKKLAELNAVLTEKLTAEADAIPNLWDRALFLVDRKNNDLWSAAVSEYLTKNPIPTISNDKSWVRPAKFHLSIDDLAKKYNIKLRGLMFERGLKTVTTVKSHTARGNLSPDGTYPTWMEEHVLVDKDCKFVINDLKTGVVERTKFHYRATGVVNHSLTVWVMTAVDKSKAMNTKAFFAAIHNPPEDRKVIASDLSAKGRANNAGSKASVLKLESRKRTYRSETNYVWANNGTTDDMDDSKTYYYVAMDHWNVLGIPVGDIKEYYETLIRSGLFTDSVYAVRKNELEVVKSKANWVPLVDHILAKLNAMDKKNVMGLVKEAIDYKSIFKYANSKLNQNGLYYKLYAEFKDVKVDDRHGRHYIEKLFRLHNINVQNVDPNALIQKYQSEVNAVKDRYPLLSGLSYHVKVDDVVDYINMIDQCKEI